MKRQIEPFPWAEIMAFGMGVLKLPPDMFWRSTPREMATAMSAFGINASPTINMQQFSKMMENFPDAKAK